jgi:hypothetical protein
MARLLLVVDTAHTLPLPICGGYRHGKHSELVLTPDVVLQPGEYFRRGDRVVLKRPFSSSINARIAGFIGIGGYGYAPPGIWVNYTNCLVIRGLSPEAVPPGTEVWSSDHRAVRPGHDL